MIEQKIRESRLRFCDQTYSCKDFGIPQWQAAGLIEDYAHYRGGEASAIASGVYDVTGSPTRSFDDIARAYASAVL